MPSTRFLFWNINRKPLATTLAELVSEQRVDVVILAESRIEPVPMLRALNAGEFRGFQLTRGVCEAIQVYTRFSSEFLVPTFESRRVSIRTLSLPARAEIILALVHLPSKLHWDDDSQSAECGELGREISEAEDQAGHIRTVLVGDFNMNPFERGMVETTGLHGTMSRTIAQRQSRIVQDRQYRFFYNPMWSHLGDSRQRAAGSYYYDSAKHVNYFWNTFDQVLIRPDLIGGFDPDRLSILTKVGALDLVRSDGRPDVTKFSDHLPIVFELDF